MAPRIVMRRKLNLYVILWIIWICIYKCISAGYSCRFQIGFFRYHIFIKIFSNLVCFSKTYYNLGVLNLDSVEFQHMFSRHTKATRSIYCCLGPKPHTSIIDGHFHYNNQACVPYKGSCARHSRKNV